MTHFQHPASQQTTYFQPPKSKKKLISKLKWWSTNISLPDSSYDQLTTHYQSHEQMIHFQTPITVNKWLTSKLQWVNKLLTSKLQWVNKLLTFKLQ
jgi:hypothetical protein